MGLQPQLLLPLADEDPEELETVLPFENPQSYVARVAMLKWQVAQQRLLAQKLPLAPQVSQPIKQLKLLLLLEMDLFSVKRLL